MKPSARKKSIKNRISLLLIGMAAIQAFVFLLVFVNIDLENKLVKKDLTNLASNLDKKKQQAENFYTGKWSNIRYMNEVIAIAEDIYKKNKSRGQSLTITTHLAQAVINMLESVGATGAFVMLDNRAYEIKNKDAFYVRDYNTRLNSMTKSDLLVELGSAKIARELDIAVNSYWTPQFEFNSDRKILLYEKILAGHKKKPTASMRDLGYWTIDYPINKSYTRVVLFVMPLIDSESADYYGMIGIELSLDWISAQLFDANSSTAKMKNAYAIALYQSGGENHNNFRPVVFDGIYYEHITADGLISLSRDSFASPKDPMLKEFSNIVYLNEDSVKKPTVAALARLDMYGQNSPFLDDQWYIMRICDKDMLISESKQLAKATWLPLVIIIIIGIAGGMTYGLTVSVQMRHLLSNLQRLSRDPTKKIKKTGISEVDQIIDSIESLNNAIEESASRMQQVISAIDIPMGAIEIDLEDDKVFMLGKAAALLRFDKGSAHKKILTLSEFRSAFNAFLEQTAFYGKGSEIGVDIDTDVYELKSGTTAHYISIHTKFSQGKHLKIVNDISAAITEKNKIEYERDHDSLTGVLNRKSFRERVAKILEKRDLKTGAMIMWDLDNLKYINDTYGHDAGDYYICATADIVSSISLANTVVARISGDEFFAFAYDFEDRSEVMRALEKIRNTFTDTVLPLPGNPKIKMRATTGIAWYPDDAVILDELIKYADFAMYGAKTTQKGSIVQFNTAKYNSDFILLSGNEDFNAFIEERQVQFAFQPIVDITTGEIFAYEALMRPQNAKIKSVFDVLRIAKNQSKTHLVETLTWYSVLDICKKNSDVFMHKKVFLNSIPNTMFTLAERNFIQKEYAQIFSHVVVEIIENEELTDECLRMIKRMRHTWNCSIAIDDFGAGYSTESALLKLKPEYVKIDMSIIRDVDTDANRQKLTTNIIEYAKPRGIKIIAEGVETFPELKKLIAMGVDFVQGFYIAKPSFEFAELDETMKKKISGIYSLPLKTSNEDESDIN